MIPNSLVTIIVIILPFAFVILIEWQKSKERKKRYELLADLYSKAIEKGQPLPTNVYSNLDSKKNKLSEGIICISIGIGLSLFLFLMSNSLAATDINASNAMKSVASVGIIPFLVGIAIIITHFIEKKKSAGDNA